jgi:hypothetical protein
MFTNFPWDSPFIKNIKYPSLARVYRTQYEQNHKELRISQKSKRTFTPDKCYHEAR